MKFARAGCASANDQKLSGAEVQQRRREQKGDARPRVLRAFCRNGGGEQIDAAFELDAWHYIVECRWRARLADIRQLAWLRLAFARRARVSPVSGRLGEFAVDGRDAGLDLREGKALLVGSRCRFSDQASPQGKGRHCCRPFEI
ncbi:hypothetical protein [Mesorhizobium sp. Root102]|uniref:hypothetical protein n=1 Tax=Mesorhizobium sp. Root102 TaxID=1736422 RepID=UPI0012E38EE2|nr:hypothetical protein [Mesorhizobium sp. Root102]